MAKVIKLTPRAKVSPAKSKSPPEGEANPVKPKTKMDKYVDALFQAFPAASYDEIRLNVQERTGLRLSPATVSSALAHLRSHAAQYGWTVPHVKVGAGTKDKDTGEENETGRFFHVLFEKDGTFTMDEEHRDYLDAGTQSRLATMITQTTNHLVMLDVSAQYDRSLQRKEYYGDASEALDYSVKRLKRLYKLVKSQG